MTQAKILSNSAVIIAVMIGAAFLFQKRQNESKCAKRSPVMTFRELYKDNAALDLEL